MARLALGSASARAWREGESMGGPKRRWRRAMAIALAISVAIVVLVACGQAASQLEPGTQVFGQVAKIDGTTIELAPGTTENGEFTRSGDPAISVDLSKARIVSDAGEELASGDIATDDLITLVAGEDGATDITVARDPETVAAEQGRAKVELSEAGTSIGEEFSSRTQDMGALKVSAADVVLVDCAIEQSGEPSDLSKARLFGLGSALLVSHGGGLVMDGGSVTSSADGAAGVFAYGEGSEAILNKTEVVTTKSNAPGVVASAKSVVGLNGALLTTSGTASPALRVSARSEAKVASGELVSNGVDSPAVQVTSNLSAEGAKLTAAHAEALVLSGSASASLSGCSIASAMDAGRGTHAPVNVQGILAFGERGASLETTTLALTGGSLTNNSGDLIYVTNVNANITLDDVRVQNADAEAALLRVAANDGSLGWGEAGANGGSATLVCVHQQLLGDIVVDRLSRATVHLTEGSRLEGAIDLEEPSEDEPGSLEVVVDAGCTWKLTADCAITSLENHGTVNFNGHTLTLADGSVLGG